MLFILITLKNTLKHQCIKNTLKHQSPKATDMKAKINKWDLIELTSFFTAKETINKTKRQPTDGEKMWLTRA